MTGTPTTTAAACRWVTSLVWLLPPLVELPLMVALGAAVPEVGREAVFGGPATRVAVLFALVAAPAGVVATVRGATGLTQAAVAGALSVAAGVVAALAVGFFDGAYPMLGLLPAHSAVALAVLAGITLRQPSVSPAGRQAGQQ
jgi:hypothetical protein